MWRKDVMKTILETKYPGSDDERQEYIVVVTKIKNKKMRHNFENITNLI